MAAGSTIVDDTSTRFGLKADSHGNVTLTNDPDDMLEPNVFLINLDITKHKYPSGDINWRGATVEAIDILDARLSKNIEPFETLLHRSYGGGVILDEPRIRSTTQALSAYAMKFGRVLVYDSTNTVYDLTREDDRFYMLTASKMLPHLSKVSDSHSLNLVDQAADKSSRVCMLCFDPNRPARVAKRRANAAKNPKKKKPPKKRILVWNHISPFVTGFKNLFDGCFGSHINVRTDNKSLTIADLVGAMSILEYMKLDKSFFQDESGQDKKVRVPGDGGYGVQEKSWEEALDMIFECTPHGAEEESFLESVARFERVRNKCLKRKTKSRNLKASPTSPR